MCTGVINSPACTMRLCASRGAKLMRSPITVGGLLSLVFLSGTALGATAVPNTYAWSEQHRGESLSLTNFFVTFSEDFNQSQITAEGGGGVWLAPVHSDVGSSTWDKPGSPYNVYSVNDG